MNGSLATVQVSFIVPSPTNPRKRFDAAKLAELAESIRGHGLYQPIVVRSREQAEYEIVCGERRWRAAQIAGLDEVPVLIRELDDAQVLEAQVIENSQREDTHPLEDCDGFKAILDSGMYGTGLEAVKQLAEKIGKSSTHVYERIQLLKLTSEVREAFLDGEITMGHAVQLARLTPESQARAITQMLWETVWSNSKNEYIRAKNRRESGNNLSVRQLASWIDQHITMELPKAPFSLKDAELLPIAGACVTCPKRTNAYAEALGEPKGKDSCLDGVCFAAKTEAFYARKVAAAFEKHPEAIKVSTSYSDGPVGVLVAAKYSRTEEGAPGAVLAVIAHTQPWALDKIGEAFWIKPGKEDSAEVKAKESAKMADLKRRLNVERDYRRRVMDAVIDLHEPGLCDSELRMVATKLLNGVYESDLDKVGRALGLTKDGSWSTTIKAHIETCPWNEVHKPVLWLVCLKELKIDDWQLERGDKAESLLECAASVNADLGLLRAEAEDKYRPKPVTDGGKPRKGEKDLANAGN